jgi:hypothetical protein
MKLIALAACALACGGVDNGDLFDSPDGGSEIGQTDQPLLAPHRGGTASIGTRNTLQGEQCDTVTSGQVCLVPKTPNIRYFMTTPGGSCAATSAQIQAVRSQVQNWFAALMGPGSGWTLSETGSVSDPLLTHVISVAAGVSCPDFCPPISGSDHIAEYACYTGTTTSFAEDPGVVGQFVKHVGVPVLHIEYQKILNRGATTTEDNNLTRWAVFNGLHRLHGIGSFPTSVTLNARCAAAVLPGFNLASQCIVPAPERCLMAGMSDFSDQANFGYTNFVCGS